MKYTVVFEECPYDLKNGIQTEETVIVTFFDHQGNIKTEKKYGYLDIGTIANLKKTKTSFMMKNLYFKDFSIRDHHDLFEWEDHRTVHSFHAEKCFFDGDTNFSDIIFGKGGFSLAHSYFGNGSINFQKAVFLSENINFSGIQFGTGEKNFNSTKFLGKNALFFSTYFGEGDVNFKCSNFENAHLNFSGAIFGAGDVDFDFSIFGNNGVDFSGVNFGTGQISFRNSHFNQGDVIFFGSSFGEGKVTFSDSVFGNGNIDFSFCRFNKCIVHFKYSKVGIGKFNMNNVNLDEGYILFKSVRFKSRSIYFLDAVIDQLTFLNCLFLEHVAMNLGKCNVLTVENCIIEKTFDLVPTHKKEMDIRVINFLYTKNLGQIYLDWHMNNAKGMIYAQGSDTNYIEKANQFRMLKENFHEIGQYYDEDNAYVEFRRCMSMSSFLGEDILHHPHRKIILLGRQILFPFKWFTFDFVGKYATNPFRILETMLLTIIVFTGLYLLPFCQLNGYKRFIEAGGSLALSNFLRALYHSIATMYTVGYGDINPGNVYAMIVSGLEGFLGLFLMSYFTVAFVRRVLR